ncbi:MAG: GLPGLI family protein [Bacteroidales bacterium]|nr:GLPGLI family protein [Acholeplasmataceae bacterium]MCK9449731.1 GLPGLI family protein [Bacteroidales bacterium]
MSKQKSTTILVIIFVLQMFPGKISAQFFALPSEILDTANVSVNYTITWKQDKNNLGIIRSEDMLLFVGKSVSLFMSKNQYKVLLIGREAESEGRLMDLLNREEIKNYVSRFSYRIYKNYPTGQITYMDKIIPTYFQYSEPLDVFQWQLADSSTTIGDFKANCAYTVYGGRRWVAWYTTDIPISDGPYKFRGLPGLIIRLYDDQKHYVFEMEKLERYEEGVPIELIDRDWVETNRTDFLKAQENLKRDIVNRAQEAGVDVEGQQQAARNAAKKNNPIEF